MVVVHHHHAHRRCFDQQIQELVLFPQADAFVFQLLHHFVKDVHHPVRFVLPHCPEAGAEILLFQQIHPVTDVL
ncbi:hypothetical protein SDC9_89003 [bioreactor metagenome]|uniref:Uncharacterized protein n=1 Tax=bioreactor metagenome TaxID=1076179 RepID=A0A644ZPM7_9ZZZZ